MKKYLIKALLCAAICGVFSACANTAELPLADDISAADSTTAQTDVPESKMPRAAANDVPAETSEQNGESDPENGFGYIADADGNIIEYVPAIDIYDNSEQTENNVDLTDTDTIFDSLNAAYPMNAAQESEALTLDNGIRAEIGKGYSKIFVNEETGCNVLAIDNGTVTDQGFRGALGLYVCIENSDGQTITYAHLGEIIAEKGDTVDKNQVIGLAGTTGYTTNSGVEYILKK